MPSPNLVRQATSRLGRFNSWLRTVDRSACARFAWAASPSDLAWHVERLGPDFDPATGPQRIEAADAARSVYYLDLPRRWVAARPARAAS